MMISAINSSYNNNVSFARRGSQKPKPNAPKQCSQCGNPDHKKGGGIKK